MRSVKILPVLLFESGRNVWAHVIVLLGRVIVLRRLVILVIILITVIGLLNSVVLLTMILSTTLFLVRVTIFASIYVSSRSMSVIGFGRH